MPFLRNVTRGRGIPDERLVEVSHHYQALGGRSPINEQNRRLQAALRGRTGRRGMPCRCCGATGTGRPIWPTSSRDAHADGQVRLLGLATSAYSSYSSCRQYREDFGLALPATGLVGRVRIDKVRPYFDQPGFRAPFVEGTVAAVRAARAAGSPVARAGDRFHHPLDPDRRWPTRSGSDRPGRPRGRRCLRGAASRRRRGGHRRRSRSESASAAPGSWPTSPGPARRRCRGWSRTSTMSSTTLAPAGTRGVIVVPIGFVSDHVEVIWDLDNEAADTAQATRACSSPGSARPGTDPRFVAALADLIPDRRRPRALPRSRAGPCPAAGLLRRPDAA